MRLSSFIMRAVALAALLALATGSFGALSFEEALAAGAAAAPANACLCVLTIF